MKKFAGWAKVAYRDKCFFAILVAELFKHYFVQYFQARASPLKIFREGGRTSLLLPRAPLALIDT